MYFVLDAPDTVFLLPDLKFLFTEYWISYPVTYRFFFHVICAFLPDRFFAVIRVVPAGLTVTVILFVAALYPAVAEERIVILALPVNFAAMVILPFFVYLYRFTAGRIFQRSFPINFCIDADLPGFCIPGPPDIGGFDGIAAFCYFDSAEGGAGGIIGSLCSVCHDRRGSSAFDGYFTGGRIYDSSFGGLLEL